MKNVAYPVRKIDDYVKHGFEEYLQETDHLANLGPEGKPKITIDGVENTDSWKVVRGYLER